MKKSALTLLLVSLTAISTHAVADNHTYTLGYAQSNVSDWSDLRGAVLKYRYEHDSAPVGVITSFSWLERKKYGVKAKRNVFTIGPAVRVNEYVSFYADAGVSVNKADDDYGNSMSRSAFAYGVGAQFNPVDTLAVDLSYQGGKIFEKTTNGFSVGVGYRF